MNKKLFGTTALVPLLMVALTSDLRGQVVSADDAYEACSMLAFAASEGDFMKMEPPKKADLVKKCNVNPSYIYCLATAEIIEEHGFISPLNCPAEPR